MEDQFEAGSEKSRSRKLMCGRRSREERRVIIVRTIFLHEHVLLGRQHIVDLLGENIFLEIHDIVQSPTVSALSVVSVSPLKMEQMIEFQYQ